MGASWASGHARRHGLIDAPGERRSHGIETPRGGGIGIVVACLGCLVAMALRDAGHGAEWLLAAGLALVAGIGWLDDHRSLPAWPRLGVHALSAGLLAAALHLDGAGTWTCLAGFLLTLGLVNAWNFMDGINGLATSQAGLCGLAFALLPGVAAPALGIAVAGACLGFLPFNFPRARLFLGDVGSGALGYLVAVLVAVGLASSAARDWPLLLLPPLAMLVDSGMTLLWRVWRGDRWWQAHVEHAYQRWARNQGHAPVALAYGLWTILMIGVMLSTWGRPGSAGSLAFLACMAAATSVWWWLHRHYIRQTEGFGS
jgi:UDP-N-acetylmuramyl pentapeptide phosphotransferase/UDP-N-acetylglucosamine-1-phosphate transferase